jgi:hypothetical protein
MNSNEFEQLLDRYWNLAHAEGYTGVSRGDEANQVLHRLREMHKGQGEPVGFITTDHAGCEVFTKTRFKLRGHEQFPVYTSAPTITEGYVLVPVEPTPEMLMAAGDAVHPAGYWGTAYRAMLAAAPKQGETA